MNSKEIDYYQQKLLRLRQNFADFTYISRCITPSILVIVALLLQLSMRQVVGGKIYLLFYPAMFFGAIIGGFWPGIIAVSLASFSSWIIFVPYSAPIAESKSNLIFAHLIFSFMGLAFCIFGEILRRSQNQERMARQKAELMTEERTQLLKKLEHQDRLKSQFFANISHELRTPITLILGPTETALSKTPKTELHPLLEQIQRNARSLLRQVNDLLDIAKLEVGKAKVNYTEFDIVKTIKQISANFETVAQEGQLQFSTELPPTLSVQADYDKFQKILINLLTNAFKFTPPGGKIRCTIKTYDPQLCIIEVADSGPGIAEEFREKVFDRFFQVEESSNRRFGGTGLGLSIVKEFTELHGGKVKLETSPEGGALFILSFPLKAPIGCLLASLPTTDSSTELFNWCDTSRKPSTTLSETDLPTTSDKLLVLVVEDNVELNQYISDIISTEFQVVQAYNGREGVELTRRLRPNLIITDIMMPVMNGQQMITEIRSQPEIANIPVIILSAKGDEEFRIKMLCDGSNDYLVKPFSAKELLTRSRKLIIANEHQTWLQSIIDQMPEGVIIFDHQGKIVHLNNVAKSLARDSGRVSGFGVPLLLDIRAPSGEVLPSEKLPVYQSFTTGKAITGAEFSILSPNGELIPVLVNAAPIKTSSGKKGAVGVFQDIRVFKELENLRKEWASMIAHELRQPVASIILRTNLLKELSFNELSNENRKSLDSILESSRILDRMINDLLDFSRIEANRMDLKQKIINLTENINRIAENFDHLSAGHVIVVANPISKIFAKVDPDRFQQIVGNLLSNAIKYSKPNSDVRLEILEHENMIEVIVTNSGAGISPDQLPQLFNRFKRTREAKTGKIGGIGLGLYIVKGLVEAHGGKIWAESTPGETTSFHFTIPRLSKQLLSDNDIEINSIGSLSSNGSDSQAQEKFKIEKNLLNSIKVLVIDDTEEMCLLLRTYLEKAGAMVTVSHSMNDALLILDKNPPDIVVSDIEMPGANGFDLIKEIHNWATQKQFKIPIIALTAHSDESQLKKISEAGFDAIISKVNSRRNLVATIYKLATKNMNFRNSNMSMNLL